MAALSWKSLSLPGVILLIALGLQAGAIKIMTHPNAQASEPATAGAHSMPAPAAHTESPPAKPASLITDPPYRASPSETPEPAHSSPSPEASSAAPSRPEAHSPEAHSPEAHSPEAHSPEVQPSPEAQILPATPHNPMVSNIPPPIELEPEPVAAKPAPSPEAAAMAAAEAHLSTTTPLIESAASTGALLEPDWVKSRDAKRYTLQLYSGKDMAKLREIAGSAPGAAPPAYFVTTSRSGPWYSLVVGDYPDFNAAQTVATQIAAQSALKPWIRRFCEIQAKMR